MRLEFELAYYDSVVLRFNHYTMRTSLRARMHQPMANNIPSKMVSKLPIPQLSALLEGTLSVAMLESPFYVQFREGMILHLLIHPAMS